MPPHGLLFSYPQGVSCPLILLHVTLPGVEKRIEKAESLLLPFPELSRYLEMLLMPPVERKGIFCGKSKRGRENRFSTLI